MSHRVLHEPGFVLHSYAYTESSVIVEAFTRGYGRVALIAKGAKKPSSNFRPVLLPLQPVSLTWTGEAEVRTLKGAEWIGGGVMPTAERLWAGLYANELLLKLLARDDAHPRLFDVYSAYTRVLSERSSDVAEVALRAFELVLLRDTGLLPKLEPLREYLGGDGAEELLSVTPEMGLQPVIQESFSLSVGQDGISGKRWEQIEVALAECMQALQPAERERAWAKLMRACESVAPALKRQLRSLLHYHCATPILKTRQALIEIQNL